MKQWEYAFETDGDLTVFKLFLGRELPSFIHILGINDICILFNTKRLGHYHRQHTAIKGNYKIQAKIY